MRFISRILKLRTTKSILVRPALTLLWLLLASLAGCSQPELNSEYGQRKGVGSGSSVNGTGVLADMFEAAGHRVTTKRFLSPKLKDYDTLVWFPDDFSMPEDAVQDFLEEWLYRGQDRTLIYVGRDYDAAPEYWSEILPDAPPDQAVEVKRRLAQSQADYASRRAAMPADKDCRWFRACRDTQPRVLGKRQETRPELGGEWAADVQSENVNVVLRGRLKAIEDGTPSAFAGEYTYEPLLSADGELLAWRIHNAYWPGGRIIVVVNGSFLLNLPLVEREHRKLAGQLVQECSESGKVAFLESGPTGLIVMNQEPGEDYPTGFEWLVTWPINIVSLHIVALGLLILFARVIVFGRPWELPAEPVSDFGKHIDALGRLLSATQDSTYASQRITEYRERATRDAGTGDETSTSS